MGAAVTLDTPQSKCGTTRGNVTNSSSRSSGKTANAQPLGNKEDKGPIGGKWSCTTFASRSSTQLPSPRGGCSWTKVGSRLLLFGGANTHQQHFADINSFDEKTGKWNKTDPRPRYATFTTERSFGGRTRRVFDSVRRHEWAGWCDFQ
eukprot:g11129.t2